MFASTALLLTVIGEKIGNAADWALRHDSVYVTGLMALGFVLGLLVGVEASR
jgi:hypothetical protein